ncbi:MAG TPA: undecaprenyldiphospho-muramoylpentapeptide beta-N-acetylglucosaminyltransferase [Syntrophales bacterium]|nr:undecaprenyldiphospho-muramoylpentapeptide beta-N-acetylglucosaminyltransferase [Syntrophales bacterium]HOX93265.1 undecaprenyldiphospho-muramoylpentapeptide beta-N-acetylglucosaminyltransferase [Syntrophales bacterium]HPI56261.1 undecaprenyldiphospho-muramoylpentapeptide beta-N-acetylglucosaminyltransferase [Syntrophales bacterium]HPN24448.1 undecaprenyldiphospho-muramoylpentapeptide beta-N-acetylglucosaminyltransferase [Syntrophales bacterium]HQM29078.1 undecaprenyldiphospho-muramoylpentap
MKVIIAGGGTGGHLFPGVAVAEEFMRRDGANRILFIGTKRGVEAAILPQLGLELATLDVAGIKGKGFGDMVKALCKIPQSLGRSFRIIRDFGPDILIGVGGYASGPAVLAACCMGVKTAVMEQNALPGVTNKILGRIVDRAFVSFEETRKAFPGKKVLLTGNPIRADFMKDMGKNEDKRDPFTVLVFGGSQGAHRINMMFLEALKFLKMDGAKPRIIHQTGNADFEAVRRAYGQLGVEADVRPFIQDMPRVFRSADLLVCRAGATSIAEITASGKAAILIPFPHAVHDHQTKNAEVLARAGAAILAPEGDLTAEGLARIIDDLRMNPRRIREMSERSRALGNARAAADIVDECLRLVAA